MWNCITALVDEIRNVKKMSAMGRLLTFYSL